MIKKILSFLNISNRCRGYGVRTIWQCPEFLFLIFGFIIIAAIFLTNNLAKHYAGPELAALLSLAVTIPLIIIAYSVIKSFEYLSLSSRIKTEFIKIMSTQLKNPLTAIKEQINIYSPKVEDAERLAFINSIKIENEKMLKTINKFLSLKEIEEGDFILNKTDFSIYDLIYDAANSARELQMNVLIKKENENPRAFADKEKIKIVLDKKNGDILEVAMLDPEDFKAIEFIKKKSDLKILPRLTDSASIKNVLKQYQKSLEVEFGEIIKKETENHLGELKKTGEKIGQEESENDLAKLAEDMPVIKIVDTLL